MMRRFLCYLTCSVLLVGCMPHAAPERRSPSPPVSQERFTPPRVVTKAATTSDEPVPALPLEHPIERLTLAQAFALTERTHPDLAVAQAQVEAAEGRLLQAGLLPNPELVARLESAPLNGDLTRRAEYVLGLSQAVPLGERLAAARRVEMFDRERLTESLALQRLAVRQRVQSAFATALYWQRVQQTLAEDVESATHGVRVASARLRAGDAIPAEVAQAEVEAHRAQGELSRATSRHAEALYALASAMGQTTARFASLEGTLEEPLALPTLEVLAVRLDQSPLLAAAMAEIARQRARLALTEAQRTPDVSLDLAYRRLGQVEHALDLGLRLPLPLFNRQQGRLREAHAEVVEAEARARGHANDLALALRTSHAKLARALATATLLREEILPRAQRVLQSAETRYVTGDSSLAELLPVRRDWTRVRLDYLEALSDVMQAWAELSPYIQ